MPLGLLIGTRKACGDIRDLRWTLERRRTYERPVTETRYRGITMTALRVMRARLPMLLGVWLALVAGCGEETTQSGAPGTPPAQAFAPVELGRITLRPAAEAGPGDLANPHLSAGRSFTVVQYDVPQFPCVRSDTNDYLHIPEVTASPGGPAVFWAVPPVDRSQPVLMVFHGNGLEFIEAEASLLAHAAPQLAMTLLANDPGMAGYIEIDNRGGALRGMRGEFASAYVAEALERGWGVVAPGNCWGDGGHHRGERIDYYIPAPRYGRLMDDDVWAWYRARFAHDAQREYSFGCSGGGQRTAQLLLNDPLAVAASGVDSPADYLPGFETDPPGLFQLISRIHGYLDVLHDFYSGHYGSLDGAAQQSLGTQLATRQIRTPIYLAYSTQDTFVTNGVSAPLVQALQARQPASRALVWNSGEPVHCQINTRERAKTALDWVAQWTRRDAG
jgi:hypothetical protein